MTTMSIDMSLKKCHISTYRKAESQKLTRAVQLHLLFVYAEGKNKIDATHSHCKAETEMPSTRLAWYERIHTVATLFGRMSNCIQIQSER